METKSKLPTIDEFPDSAPIYMIDKEAKLFQSTFIDTGDFIVYSPTKLFLGSDKDLRNFYPMYRGLRNEPDDLLDMRVKVAMINMPVHQQLTEDEYETLFLKE